MCIRDRGNIAKVTGIQCMIIVFSDVHVPHPSFFHIKREYTIHISVSYTHLQKPSHALKGNPKIFFRSCGFRKKIFGFPFRAWDGFWHWEFPWDCSFLLRRSERSLCRERSIFTERYIWQEMCIRDRNRSDQQKKHV